MPFINEEADNPTFYSKAQDISSQESDVQSVELLLAKGFKKLQKEGKLPAEFPASLLSIATGTGVIEKALCSKFQISKNNTLFVDPNFTNKTKGDLAPYGETQTLSLKEFLASTPDKYNGRFDFCIITGAEFLFPTYAAGNKKETMENQFFMQKNLQYFLASKAVIFLNFNGGQKIFEDENKNLLPGYSSVFPPNIIGDIGLFLYER